MKSILQGLIKQQHSPLDKSLHNHFLSHTIFKMGRRSRHASQCPDSQYNNDGEDIVDNRTEYEKARDLRAKALRKEIALTLVAFGHVDVVPLGDLFGSALLPLSAMLAVPRGSSRKKILARGTA
jgi:hypothetical protein